MNIIENQHTFNYIPPPPPSSPPSCGFHRSTHCIHLSLFLYHYFSITISLSLFLYHYFSITISLSLFLYHYFSITISLSLFLYHYFSITISLYSIFTLSPDLSRFKSTNNKSQLYHTVFSHCHRICRDLNLRTISPNFIIQIFTCKY